MAIWIIGAPMVVAIVYYALFAVDRYVSATQITVRQAGTSESAQIPGLAVMLGGGVNPASREETLYLREFITSSDMLKVLEEKLHWKEHYAGKWQDPLYLVFKNASDEFWL
ncbi:MAG TPA: ABC transporter permease, partial [Bordetella sp.]|nr:ABC transporter permease [Bordetella sp.]